MKATDQVDLIYVTQQGYVTVFCVPLSYASEQIANWYTLRVNKTNVGTVEINAQDDDGNVVSVAAIAVETITGMYIREREDVSSSSKMAEMQKRLAEAQEKIAETFAKDSRRNSQGDEWKEGEN